MITINGKEYKVKYTIRALFIFEQITGKAFSVKTLLDNYLFFYSMLLANNEDVLGWEEFLDALDNDPTLLEQLQNVTLEANAKDDLFEQEQPDGEKKS